MTTVPQNSDKLAYIVWVQENPSAKKEVWWTVDDLEEAQTYVQRLKTLYISDKHKAVGITQVITSIVTKEIPLNV